MKTTLLRSWKLVTVVAGLALLAGSFRGPGTSASAEEQRSGDDPPAAVPANTNAADATLPAPEPAPAVTVKLSPTAAEIVRLAESGMGEGVMLAFTANSTGTFNLGSDQIINLNDLGVPATVITAMIQHDLALKTGSTDGVPPVPTTSIPADNVPPATEAVAPTLETYSPDFTAYDPGFYAGQDNYVPPDDSSDYFHDSLAPYGNWIDVVGFGRCWQPTVVTVNHDWRPYCDRGRWLNTDCGWCWQSDYSWGWAAFHYGRWFEDGRHGWVWRPDREWAPAWVSWRQSPEYCGWAPLPPQARFVPGIGFRFGNRAVAANFEFGLQPSHYTFIPVERLIDYAPYRYRVSPWQVDNVHGATTVINHVTFENHHAIHHGVDPRYVAEVSHTEVRKVVVRDAPASRGGNPRLEHLEKNGDTLVLLRPQLPPPAGIAARPGSAPIRPGTPAGGPVKPVATAPLPGHEPATSLAAQASAPKSGQEGASAGPPQSPTAILATHNDPVKIGTTIPDQTRRMGATPGISVPPTTGVVVTVSSHPPVVGTAAPTAPVSNPAHPTEPAAPTSERVRRLPNMNLANQPAPKGTDYYPGQAKATASQDAGAGPLGNRTAPAGGWQLFQSQRPPADLESQTGRAPLPSRDPLAPAPAPKVQPNDLDRSWLASIGYASPQIPASGNSLQHFQPNVEVPPSAAAPVQPVHHPEPVSHVPAAESHGAPAQHYSAPPPAPAPVAHAPAPAPAPASSSQASSTKK